MRFAGPAAFAHNHSFPIAASPAATPPNSTPIALRLCGLRLAASQIIPKQSVYYARGAAYNPVGAIPGAVNDGGIIMGVLSASSLTTSTNAPSARIASIGARAQPAAVRTPPRPPSEIRLPSHSPGPSRDSTGPTRDVFFMIFLLRPIHNPAADHHFRALRAVSASALFFAPFSGRSPSSPLIQITKRTHSPLCVLRALCGGAPSLPRRKTTKRTHAFVSTFVPFSWPCGLEHHFVVAVPPRHDETNPFSPFPAPPPPFTKRTQIDPTPSPNYALSLDAAAAPQHSTGRASANNPEPEIQLG